MSGKASVVPIEGQSFSSEQDWINRASRVLTDHPDYNNAEHGDWVGWRGAHFTALCFDQAGNRMRNGGDFMRATREGTYPVWWVWPDQFPSLIADYERMRGAAEYAVERFGMWTGITSEAEHALDRLREALTQGESA